MRRIAILIAALLAVPASAHDKWADGTAVPEWVKAKCCHADEAKDLTEMYGVTTADIQTHKEPINGGAEHGIVSKAEITVYHIRGFRPDTYSIGVYPSQDGHIWVFSDKSDPKEALHFWCMFLPCAPKNDAAPSDFGGECS